MKLRITKYLQASSNAFAENKLLKVCCVLTLLATVINTVNMIHLAKNKHTIIIPAGLGFEMEISGDHANDLYLQRMARYLIELKGNISAANVENKTNELLIMVHASQYGLLRDRWIKEAEQIKKYPALSYVVTLKENKPITVENGRRLYIHADKQRIIGQKIARRTPLQYRIDFIIENGRFWLRDIQEIADD